MRQVLIVELVADGRLVFIVWSRRDTYAAAASLASGPSEFAQQAAVLGA